MNRNYLVASAFNGGNFNDLVSIPAIVGTELYFLGSIFFSSLKTKLSALRNFNNGNNFSPMITLTTVENIMQNKERM